MTTYAIINRTTLDIKKIYSKDPGDEIQFIPELSEPICAHIVVAEELDPDCIKAEVTEDPVTHVTSIIIVSDPDKVMQKIYEGKRDQINAATKIYDADILAKQVAIYGTANAFAAIASQITYMDMLASPTTYISEYLATTEAVLAYANAKMAVGREFSVYRINRKIQLDLAINVIINS